MRPLAYFEARCVKDAATGCWDWTQSLNHNGYGKFGDEGRKWRRTHRGAWEAAHGPVPSGMMVCHRCDNRRCCNPDHLFLGTQADNMHDMVAKGRHLKVDGRHRRHSKLLSGDVALVKLLLSLDVAQARLGALWGVHPGTISAIRRDMTWKHVESLGVPVDTRRSA